MFGSAIRNHMLRFSNYPVGYICRFHTMAAKPHVGIVGAGISGLRCADILVRNGARVTILEARDRIGGRVCLYFLALRFVIHYIWDAGVALDSPFAYMSLG